MVSNGIFLLQNWNGDRKINNSHFPFRSPFKMIHANFSIKVFQFGHKPFPCFMIQFISSETDLQTNFRFRYKYKIIWNLKSNFIFIWDWNVNFHINCHQNGVYFYFNMPIYHFEILISPHAALHGRRYFNMFNHIINTFKWIERMAYLKINKICDLIRKFSGSQHQICRIRTFVNLRVIESVLFFFSLEMITSSFQKKNIINQIKMFELCL